MEHVYNELLNKNLARAPVLLAFEHFMTIPTANYGLNSCDFVHIFTAIFT